MKAIRILVDVVLIALIFIVSLTALWFSCQRDLNPPAKHSLPQDVQPTLDQYK